MSLSEKQREEAIIRFMAGESYNTIAKSFEVNRNVVGSFLWRNNIRRGSCHNNSAKSDKPFVPKLKLVKLKPAPKILLPAPELIGPIGDYPENNGCQYIPGEVSREFQMCGHPSGHLHKKYCDWHMENVISPRKAA